MTDAVVLLDKKAGITSFTCLNTVKKTVNKKTGHCGTLDKFATGLLIALCGKYTKLNQLFMGLDKTYIAKIEFGKETDTLDPEGKIIDTKALPTFEEIEKKVKSYVGKIIQIPPVYSAVHIGGKRSYKLARQGQNVQPEGREVEIYRADIISYDAPFLTIELNVSKGTYIRSYARDLGRLCSSCAYVKELRRTQIGPFNIYDAIKSDDINALATVNEDNSKKIIDMLKEYRDKNEAASIL